MNGNFIIGTIIHHLDFEFENGTKRNKYLVVLGAKPRHNYLCALTTSKQWRMGVVAGCHHKPRTYFFIPGDGRNFFHRDTWMVLSDPQILSRAEVIQKNEQNIIQFKANLNPTITGAIRNCLKASKDISKTEKQLL